MLMGGVIEVLIWFIFYFIGEVDLFWFSILYGKVLVN